MQYFDGFIWWKHFFLGKKFNQIQKVRGRNVKPSEKDEVKEKKERGWTGWRRRRRRKKGGRKRGHDENTRTLAGDEMKRKREKSGEKSSSEKYHQRGVFIQGAALYYLIGPTILSAVAPAKFNLIDRSIGRL